MARTVKTSDYYFVGDHVLAVLMPQNYEDLLGQVFVIEAFSGDGTKLIVQTDNHGRKEFYGDRFVLYNPMTRKAIERTPPGLSYCMTDSEYNRTLKGVEYEQ